MPLVLEQRRMLGARLDGSLGDVAQRFPGSGASNLHEIAWFARGKRRGFRPLDPSEDKAKRVLDVVCAVGLLIVTAPILVVAMLAVALTSPGPVIYTQIRTGLNRRGVRQPDRRQRTDVAPPGGVERRSPSNPDRRASRAFGRPFVIYKLRTMRVDAERDGAQLARIGDDRVTPVGRFLRRTRIDELPQLWNVLRGDMSIVGPRPERPEFIGELSKEVPGYLDRLGVRPGLTGLAQVLNGYDADLDSVRRKIRLDLLYLEHYSLLADIKILLRTVGVVLRGTGAR
jgi:lipopolysaccharide/colanic/teichoic acid biosynthesis glycosyltransferase